MSEQNVLNTTAASLLNFDYGYSAGLPEIRSTFEPASGRPFARDAMGRGRIYELAWNKRDLATERALQQFANQYSKDFFSLADWELGRYFTGRFDAPLIFSPSGNQSYNIRGRFVELPGVGMFSYPSNWTDDAIFLEHKDGWGDDLVKLAGTWTLDTSANHHGGDAYKNVNTNTTDAAEWLYFGYGFQLWAMKASNLGILSLSATRVRDAFPVVAPTNVDLYNASTLASAALFTITGLALDQYRVKITATNTKNASSSAKDIFADAVQVMK